jgi:hypothetical protein
MVGGMWLEIWQWCCQDDANGIRWVKQNKWCEGKDDKESEQVCLQMNRDNAFWSLWFASFFFFHYAWCITM